MSHSSSKRSRPPNINLSLATQNRPNHIQVDIDVDVDNDNDIDIDNDNETLQLSSGESSPSTPPSIPSLKLDTSDDDSNSDDIARGLQELRQLRKSVKQNLKLRPIRSRGALPKIDIGDLNSTPPKSPWHKESAPESASSPASSTASIYFTPLSTTHLSTPFTAASTSNFNDPSSSSDPSCPRAIQPAELYKRLTSTKRPLLIDTRPPTSFVSFHVKNSVNIAIPSLILKRCRKPAGGFQSLDALRQFITTDGSKQSWDALMSNPQSIWDGNVVIYDDEMDLKDKDNVGVTSWSLIPVISPLVTNGSVDYLKGGISAAGHDSAFETLIISGGEFNFGFNVDSPPPQAGGGGLKKGGGLFQLDTHSAFLSKPLPELEPSSTVSLKPPSPLPVMPGAISSSHNLQPPLNNSQITDSSPSPPPSHIGFHRPPPPNRRPSQPTLRRIDTRSAERLNTNVPSLSIRTRPLRSATLAVPPSLHFPAPASPSHLNLVYSNHSPPGSAARFNTPSSPSHDMYSFLTPYYTPPHTPGTPKPFLPPSPITARPEIDNPPTTEEAFPAFSISTILPNFLYTGPELTTPEHVSELLELGVKRILNIAIECDDDQGLNLRDVFKYHKIPMRDIVEEDNISRGVKEACELIDDARLHSAPVYVHCKAGKSRSVTAVIAYLIHANHWTLSRAYSFVLERRKGISPNIGFVSELMSFEEQELGGKSIGVQPSSNTSQHDQPPPDTSFGAAVAGGGHLRRGVRESLPPPVLTNLEGIAEGSPGAVSAGGFFERVNSDSGQEMEIKDASGRYRHARRAPVDENTLQPLRRFSYGMWWNRSGCLIDWAVEAVKAEALDESIRCVATSKHITHRGDTLNAPTITVECSSPAPDILLLTGFHWKRQKRMTTGPSYELFPDVEVETLTTNRQDSLSTSKTNTSLKIETTSLSATIDTRPSSFNVDIMSHSVKNPTMVSKAPDHLLTKLGWRSIGYIKKDTNALNPQLSLTDPDKGERWFTMQFQLSVGEKIYGLGERFGPFIKNGQCVEMWNEDSGTSSEMTYKNVPFFLSSRGYGIFVPYPGFVSFEVQSERTTRVNIAVPGESLSVYIIHGPSPKDIIQRYALLTGRPALPPPWTFGLWLSTSFTTSYDETTVNKFLEGMDKRDIPVGVFHYDCFWQKGFHWCDYEFDKDYFPDTKVQLARLKDKGYNISVWLNPYIAQESKIFDEGAENGYFIKKADGSVWQHDFWQAGMAIIDFTNPSACKWYQSKLEALIDLGVDCFKTDFGERIPTGNTVYHDNSDPEKMHNYFAFLYNKVTFEVLERKLGRNQAVVFARSTTAGGQRFPVHWGGDPMSTFEAMSETLRGGLSLGLCGYGYWARGFEGTPDPALYKRWFAFGALSSHSRLHGSGSYRVPWLIDESGEADIVLKRFIDLKLSLMPYLYSTAIQTHQTGVPMMRPLFVEFPEDPFVWNVDTQYMLGADLMVVPVFNAEGAVQYFVPSGSWYGVLDGKLRRGPSFVTETHDFSSLPLLLRPGSAIVMRDDVPRLPHGRKHVVYDYSQEITVLVNLANSCSVDLLVQLPDSSKPGSFSAQIMIRGDEKKGSVEVVKGALKGKWKIKKINSEGNCDLLLAEDGAKHLAW
ncbi:hypothetical protein H0H93_007852 [Arthromyces matolae]|nr:hypothetical protein H0H93_007852 [Arthromyces matolae]